MKLKFWQKKPVVGIGIGVGLAGAVAVALRYGFRRQKREPIPDSISPAIFATRVAQTTAGEILYHVSGSGTPIVFLHGIYIGASSYEWSKIYPDFAMDHEVIVPDLIGFGESERPASSMDATDYSDSLEEFIREVCGGRKPVIVASGLTAGIALLLASRHPELLHRLILLLPTGLKESGKWRGTGMLAWSNMPVLSKFVYRNYLARTPFVRGWLSRYAFTDATKVTDEMVQVLSTCAQQYGAEHAILGFLRGRLAFDIESRFSSVAVPVSILWPGRASDYPIQIGEALCSRLSVVSLEVIPETGVLAALESPEVVGAAVRRNLFGEIRLDPAG